MNACGAGALARELLGEQIFERFAIFEIDRNVEIARHIGLADIKLLQQGREEFAGVEGVRGCRAGVRCARFGRRSARPSSFRARLPA